jgi:ferredoxin-nitrate reductase
LEEYYTLGVIGMAGIGTPHMDGNTRLCTATANQALKESFGSDGDPGCYEDINDCDTLFLVGHNVAETQTVMWMRMLDRLHGPDRPKLVVVDPRSTPAAREADVHLAIRNAPTWLSSTASSTSCSPTTGSTTTSWTRTPSA